MAGQSPCWCFLWVMTGIVCAWECVTAAWYPRHTISAQVGQACHDSPPWLAILGAGAVLLLWHFWESGK